MPLFSIFCRGVTPLGENTEASIQDGHKFGCGIHLISETPIVYSFGSNRQQGIISFNVQVAHDMHLALDHLVV